MIDNNPNHLFFNIFIIFRISFNYTSNKLALKKLQKQNLQLFCSNTFYFIEIKII